MRLSDDNAGMRAVQLPVAASRRGRPPLLDPRRRQTFLAAIRAGNRLQVAARFAGISPSTVEEWVRRGQGRDSVRPKTPFHVQLVEDIENAKADAEVYALAIIRAAMREDPKWAVWFLENTDPYWRQRRVPPSPPVVAQLPADPGTLAQTSNVIVISREDLKAIASQRLLAQLTEPEPSAADRAGLVVEH